MKNYVNFLIILVNTISFSKYYYVLKLSNKFELNVYHKVLLRMKISFKFSRYKI